MFSKIVRIILPLGVFIILSTASAEEAIIFETPTGEQTDAFEGVLFVPENRSAKNSRKIPIRYIRFPSTSDQPGSPIIYLSGGPGGSGIRTAKHRRYSLFMEMRKHADVIALDQRGTGKSNDTPHCESSIRVPLDRVLENSEFFDFKKRALLECLLFWEQKGIDIYGYTTPESAHDLDDLRKHLGAEKVSLWGISYGSHLALAALKSMSSRLDKVIIASVEGLDQTVKMPVRTDAYFDRLQRAIDRDVDLKKQLPDVKALIRRVLTKLDAQPMILEVPSGENSIKVLLAKRDVQHMLAATISDPAGALRMLQLCIAIEQGITEPVVEVLKMFGEINAPIGYRAMPVAMDLASGQSKQRYAEIMDQAKTSLLGSFLNSSIHLTGVIPGIDLGDDFRTPPNSDVPTLVLRGNLDGRIYPQSQLEATSGLKNRKVIDVINAGHNLFMTSPKVAEVMHQFMQGVDLDKDSIVVDLPW